MLDINTDTKPKLYEKLLKFQKEIEPILKSKTNPFYKSSYSDINDLLAVIKPMLTKLKIVILQPLSTIYGNTQNIPAIRTILYDIESGETLSEVFPLMESKDVQKQGGAITYTRRYALQAMLALEAEDDDGNSNVEKPAGKKVEPKLIDLEI